jgi:hypothetical protein
LVSPDEPASWTDNRWTSPYVAWSLTPLAPRLAPRVSLALLIRKFKLDCGPDQVKVAPAELVAPGRAGWSGTG